MELVIRKFSELSLSELYEIIKVRESVFVVEQNCPYQETDGLDQNAIHLYYRDNERITAYCRIFRRDETTAQIGRFLTTERGTGLGLRLLEEAVSQIQREYDPETVYIEAQCYATGFYEKAGFRAKGEPFDEDGIMHTVMELKLKQGEC